MRKIVKTIIFMIIILLLGYSSSYAAVIQIKNTTDSVLTNATISDFYEMSEGLKGTGQALDGVTVDVKMANNYEWAVVSYFSNSAYGTNGAGQNTGKSFGSGATKYSTNGNITGVMNWGKTYTYTAGIIASYASKTLTTAGNLTSNPSISKIVENASTNKVDKFGNAGEDSSIALTGWYNSWIKISNNENGPYSFRDGLFGFQGGAINFSPYYSTGAGAVDVTFRPVIWN